MIDFSKTPRRNKAIIKFLHEDNNLHKFLKNSLNSHARWEDCFIFSKLEGKWYFGGNSFSWALSPEGSSYWIDVVDRFEIRQEEYLDAV